MRPCAEGLRWVQTCIRVVLNHTKKGFLSFTFLSMNLSAAARISWSMVSIRFEVSGPVSSIRWPPLPSDQVWSTPRGPYFFLKAGILRVVVGLRLFLGVQVIEVSEELVEAVHRRQVLSRSPRWFLPNWPVA